MSEKKEKVYPKGVRVFAPRQGAPEFVKGEMVIGIEELIQFCKGEGSEYLSEYNGKKQIKLTLLEGRDGMYPVVNTWKPEQKKVNEPVDDDLPF